MSSIRHGAGAPAAGYTRARRTVTLLHKGGHKGHNEAQHVIPQRVANAGIDLDIERPLDLMYFYPDCMCASVCRSCAFQISKLQGLYPFFSLAT